MLLFRVCGSDVNDLTLLDGMAEKGVNSVYVSRPRITAAALSSAICAWVKPNSVRTSSLCSPNIGTGSGAGDAHR